MEFFRILFAPIYINYARSHSSIVYFRSEIHEIHNLLSFEVCIKQILRSFPKIQLALKKFNFSSMMRDRERWLNYGSGETCLSMKGKLPVFHLITEFCKNLQKVKQIMTGKELFESVNFNKWLNLSSLTHVGFVSLLANTLTISVLNQMPCLKSIQWLELILEIGEVDENEPPNKIPTDYPKLNISSLEIGIPKFDFWRVVNLEYLEKLNLSISSPEKFQQSHDIVLLCPNLQTVLVSLHDFALYFSEEISELITTVESLPKFQNLVLTLETEICVLRDLLENCAEISKYTREIFITSSTVKQRDFATIFRLKHIRKLTWFCASFDHELIFENLLKLEVVKTSFDTMHYVHPGTSFLL